MYKYLLILCLSINVSYASAVKLVDYLVSGTGITEILAKHGIRGDDAKQVKSYVASSIAALGNGKDLSKEELLQVISKLPTTGADATKRKNLQLLLDTPADKIKKSDVVSAINDMTSLASRYGTSVILTCASCVNSTLAKEGFAFTVSTVKNVSTLKLINDVIPKDSTKLPGYITSSMKRLGFGDYAKVAPGVVQKEEERKLAVFFAMGENGTADQKKFVALVKKASTRKGSAPNMFDTKNPHKLWSVLSEDMSDDDLKGWIAILEEVTVKSETDSNFIAQDAFYRVIEKKAGNDAALQKHYKALKAKNCFFSLK